jgi:glycerol uptake facilitator-like aquaporin
MTAEFIGTFFLVLMGLGGVYASAIITHDTVTVDRQFYMALSYGFSYAAIVYALSFPSKNSISPANARHMNPAVSLTQVLSGKILMDRFIFYVVAQIAGAAVGVFFLHYTVPRDEKDVTTSYPLVEGLNNSQAWVMELMISFIMLIVVLVTSFGWLQRAPSLVDDVSEVAPQTHHELNCVVLGGTVFVCCALGSPVSGGYMNPLFAMGIAILSGRYSMAAFFAPLISAAGAVAVAHIFGYRINFARVKRGFSCL